MQNTALSKINMANVVEETAEQLTNENLVTLNLDIIIDVKTDRNAELDKTAILENPILSDVSAVKSQNFMEILYEFLMDYGSSTFDGIKMIYGGIYAK